MPLELVTPPWDLCGGPGLDPYSLDESEVPWRYRELVRVTGPGLAHLLERHVERVIDPNRRDGQWYELAFMPYAVERVPNGVEMVMPPGGREVYRALWLAVPRYVTVAEALFSEAMSRRMLEHVRAVESVHERVACPKCPARVGERCVAVRGRGAEGVVRYEAKHPHSERLHADGIYER